MCEKKTITLRNADSSPRRKSGLGSTEGGFVGALREVLVGNYEERRATANMRENRVIWYSTQWEHHAGFWREIMRNGKYRRVKIASYGTPRNGSTAQGFGLDACKSRDTILNSGSGHLKNTRYNTAHSGSTEGGNYEELRVTANVFTREKHAIRWCPHCGHRVGFWRKTPEERQVNAETSFSLQFEVEDCLIYLLYVMCPDTLNHAECDPISRQMWWATWEGEIQEIPNKAS
ncbi:hypothetical protein B0H11DRAFT_1901665 [Mycena galericulata]|nr:hypothetical protein B0H11DRAFT_1901665 [Mycena galericulata]